MGIVFDPDTESGTHALRRLDDSITAWLTSVDRAGTPQPAPVWFLWNRDESTALLYSQPSARRLSRIEANPRSSLHLNDDGQGGDLVILTGILQTATDTPPAHELPDYAEKYDALMTESFGSPEQFSAMYSVPLLFRATHARGG